MTFEEACQALSIDPAEAQAMGYWHRRAVVHVARDITKYGTEAVDPAVGETYRALPFDRTHLPSGL